MNWNIKNINPIIVQIPNAIYDGNVSDAGDPGMSSSPKNTTEMIAPITPNTVYSVLLCRLSLKNLTVTKLVAKNAIDTPTDDMSTIQLSAVRPNQGAVRHTTMTNRIAFSGVFVFLCSFEKASGINFARPNAKISREDDK